MFTPIIDQRPHITRHNLPSNPNFDFYDSYTEIVTLTVFLPKPYTITDIKQAINLLKGYVREYVYLDRPCSQYDCTGEHFTTNLQIIRKEISYYCLHYTYEHSISIDC